MDAWIVAPSWPIGLGELHSKTAQDDLTLTFRPELMSKLHR